jgi:hypothetical protein
LVTNVLNCQFIFRPGDYDDDFRRLDAEIDSFARSLPGFVDAEIWYSEDRSVVNASYMLATMEDVRRLSEFPAHLEAKSQVLRWYKSHRVIVSEVMLQYGDDVEESVT